MEKKLTCLILLFFITIDATVVTKRHLFTSVMGVASQDPGVYNLSSNTGIQTRIMCATYCEKEECLSFSYKEVDKRCDTYSRMIVEEMDADVSITTPFYSKVLVRSCADVPDEYPSGVYKITTTEGIAIDLFCDMDKADGPWTVIQRRIHADVDFYRNWTDYKNGFGDLHGNFWIGNDNLHLLTKTSRTLRLELEGWDGTKGYAQYSQFQVANEDQKYTLLVQGFSGNVSRDGMISINGRSFSTYDRDNDLRDGRISSCAAFGHGAWWYKACAHSNLNGRYQPDSGNEKKAMWWWNFPDVSRYYEPLKKTTMLIR